jgi:hypothetical protein
MMAPGASQSQRHSYLPRFRRNGEQYTHDNVISAYAAGNDTLWIRKTSLNFTILYW